MNGTLTHNNETYKKHSAVLKACIAADISELPIETAEYFGEKYSDEYLLEQKLQTDVPTHKYNTDGEDGFEIIVSEIPKGVHKIRFVNSY